MGITEDLMNMNLYKFLNCEVTADEMEIRKAFRKKSLTCHPDKHPNNPKAVELFKMLNAAVEILTDKKLRACYDRRRKASIMAHRRRVLYKGRFDISHIKEGVKIPIVRPVLIFVTVLLMGILLNSVLATSLRVYIARRGTPSTTVKLSAENLRRAFLFQDLSPNIQFSEMNAERRAREERLKKQRINACSSSTVQSSQNSSKQSFYVNFPSTSWSNVENDPSENGNGI